MIRCEDCKTHFIESSKKLYERIRSNYKLQPFCKDCSRINNAKTNYERRKRKLLKLTKKTEKFTLYDDLDPKKISVPYLQRKYKLAYKDAGEVLQYVQSRNNPLR